MTTLELNFEEARALLGRLDNDETIRTGNTDTELDALAKLRAFVEGRSSPHKGNDNEDPIDLAVTRCLPELWHVQATKNGAWLGYYQFFHPNPEAARKEAERLRRELPGFEVHVGRYVLAEIEPGPSSHVQRDEA